jgi:hypothetical protein
MHYKETLKQLQLNKQKRLAGDVISIPWSLPRLSKILPGIEKSRYYLVTASAKAGKSQLTDYLFVYQPIEWLMNNMDSNISLKIFYFSLEMSIKAKLLSAMCYKLFQEHQIVISPQDLSSVFSSYIMDDEIEQLIQEEKFTHWFDTLESVVTYHDDVRNPYGIFKVIKSYAEHPDNGRYTYKSIPWQNDDGTFIQKTVRDKYIPVRPNEYVLIIVDHIGLLQPKAGDNLHQAISEFSSGYCLEMRDRWGYSPVIVQQQTADSSKAQFTVRGDTIIDKIKPDQEGLADNKYTARDVDLMISLFYPKRYNINFYEGIDLTKIGEQHREFAINLNRNGISNASLQLFFVGSNSYFEELPKEINDFDYERYNQLLTKNKRNK